MNKPIENIDAEQEQEQRQSAYEAHDADRHRRIAENEVAKQEMQQLEHLREQICQGRRIQASEQLELEIRRERVARHYLQGMSIRQIAGKIGVDFITAYRDLVACREEWRAARIGFTDRVVAEQLEKLDRYELEANESWERSKQPAKSTTIIEDDDGKTKTRIERQESSGDPRFLALAVDIVKQRRELLGTDAPKKTESTVNATVTYQHPPSRQEVADKVREAVNRMRQSSVN